MITMRGVPGIPPRRRTLRQWVRERLCDHKWDEVHLASGKHWYVCHRCGRTEW